MYSKGLHLRPWLVISFLLVICMGYAGPAYAAPDEWTEFARALNNSMGGNQLFTINSFIVLSMTIVIAVLLAALNHIYWKNRKEEIIEYEKRRLEHSEQPAPQPQPTGSQRRQWFRIKSSLLFKWIQSWRAAMAKENHYHKDQLVDIGGGGLSFTTKSALFPGDELHFQLDIGGKKPLNFKGKVLRVQNDGDTVQPTYFVAIQFSDLLSGERDRLVSWIIKGQREELQEVKMEEKTAPPA